MASPLSSMATTSPQQILTASPREGPTSATERYAQQVVNYSKLDASTEYLSGINFLISPYKSYGEEWAISIPDDGFHSVTVCDLTKAKGNPARTTLFSRPEEFTPFVKEGSTGKRHNAHRRR
jgi:hypothetical protein